MIILISQKLGENIKKIRTRKGMSQGDICRALDIDRGYMSAIENGKKNILYPIVGTIGTSTRRFS